MNTTHQRNVFAVTFNASDSLVISGCNGGQIHIHDTVR